MWDIICFMHVLRKTPTPQNRIFCFVSFQSLRTMGTTFLQAVGVQFRWRQFFSSKEEDTLMGSRHITVLENIFQHIICEFLNKEFIQRQISKKVVMLKMHVERFVFSVPKVSVVETWNHNVGWVQTVKTRLEEINWIIKLLTFSCTEHSILLLLNSCAKGSGWTIEKSIAQRNFGCFSHEPIVISLSNFCLVAFAPQNQLVYRWVLDHVNRFHPEGVVWYSSGLISVSGKWACLWIDRWSLADISLRFCVFYLFHCSVCNSFRVLFHSCCVHGYQSNTDAGHLECGSNLLCFYNSHSCIFLPTCVSLCPIYNASIRKKTVTASAPFSSLPKLRRKFSSELPGYQDHPFCMVINLTTAQLTWRRCLPGFFLHTSGDTRKFPQKSNTSVYVLSFAKTPFYRTSRLLLVDKCEWERRSFICKNLCWCFLCSQWRCSLICK